MSNTSDLMNALICGDADAVTALTGQAVRLGMKPIDIMNDGLVAAMDEVGRRFKSNEFYFPEVLLAARAMHSGLAVLKPLLAESHDDAAATFLIGTVKGDVHDIGKNLVAMMMEGAGLRVVDIGIDVPASRFVEAVQEYHPEIVGLSALLTTTMPAMKTVIQALESSGLRDQVRVMVGGAPVTQHYADSIGADGYAQDASMAVDVARSLLRANRAAGHTSK